MVAAQAATVRANRLADLGRVEEATEAAAVAGKLLEALPADSRSSDDVATMELSLAKSLIRLGSQEVALPHAERAERLFRIRASENPYEFLEYAAAAANAYSLCLSRTGSLGMAQAAEESGVSRNSGNFHPARLIITYPHRHEDRHEENSLAAAKSINFSPYAEHR